MNVSKHPNLFILAAMILLTFFNPVKAQKSDANWLEGNWQGAGKQMNGQSFTITLAVNRQGYLVDYAPSPCRGKWSLIDISKKKAKFIENIAPRPRNCLDGLTMEVEKITDEQIRVRAIRNGIFLIAVFTLQKKHDLSNFIQPNWDEFRRENGLRQLGSTKQETGDYALYQPAAYIDCWSFEFNMVLKNYDENYVISPENPKYKFILE